MSAPPNSEALAVSLARPVRFGWLTIQVADVVLVRAADQCPVTRDLLSDWNDLRIILRAKLADAQREAAR